MRLLEIAALAWLPLVAGIIVLLYLLKPRRKDVTVSSVMLWQRAVQDFRATAPWQKLRKNLLLFLQLAAAILLFLSLAQPIARARGLVGRSVIVIVDVSASMRATDVSGSRLDQAKHQALRVVSELGKGDQMMVLAASNRTAIAVPFTADASLVRSGIASLTPTDCTTNLRDALVTATSLAATRKAPRDIFLVSDGAVSPITDLSPGDVALHFIKVGERSNNVGITALEVRKEYAGAATQVFVGMRNFSDEAKEFVLELYVEDRLVDARSESLPAGATRAAVIPAPPGSGLLTARLDLKDDLETDNRAYAFLEERKQVPVVLVTKGNLFLESALNVIPEVDLVRTANASEAARAAKQNLDAVVIFDGIGAPDTGCAGDHLYIAADGPQAPARLGQAVAGPRMLDWDRDHPLNRFVNFAALLIAKAQVLEPRPWGRPLAFVSEGPVLAAGEQGRKRYASLGFSPHRDSDWPLRVSFPVFVANCVAWLSHQGEAEENFRIRCGQPAHLRFEPETESVSIREPGGKEQTFPVQAGALLYQQTDTAGIYQVEAGKKRFRFVSNLLDAEESNLAPREAVRIGETTMRAARGRVLRNLDLWPFAALLLLGLLAFEWHAYHTRL